jgi:hypothetical protein
MGRHQAPRGRSRGKYTPGAGKLGGPPSSIQALREKLASKAPDGDSYGNIEFLLTVQYIDDGERPILVELQQCVITGNDTSNEESADPLKEEIEIMPMRVLRNGKTLYDKSQGTP